MFFRIVRLAAFVSAAGYASWWFHHNHDALDSQLARGAAVVALLGTVFVLASLKSAMIALSPEALEAEAAAGCKMAITVRKFRANASYMLLVMGFMSTISTLMLGDLTEATMPSFGAKVAMAIVITIVAEVLADNVGIKYKLRLASALAPLTQLLFDVLIFVKPLAWLITKLLGHEEPEKLKEQVLAYILEKEALINGSELGAYERHIALHAIKNDHTKMKALGNPIDPETLIEWLHFVDGMPALPERGTPEYQALLGRLSKTRRRWAVFVDGSGEPKAVLDARKFGAELGYNGTHAVSIYHFTHPAKVVDGEVELGEAIYHFELEGMAATENVVKIDVILVRCTDGFKLYTAADNFGDQVTGLIKVRNALPTSRVK